MYTCAYAYVSQKGDSHGAGMEGHTCPDENMSFACRRLMTGQRNWILSGDLSESAREEEARPMWTTAERDLRNRRVWVGSSPDLGITSIIPMRE